MSKIYPFEDWTIASEKMRKRWATEPNPVNCAYIEYVKSTDGKQTRSCHCRHPKNHYSCYYVYIDESVALAHCPGFKSNKLLGDDFLKIE